MANIKSEIEQRKLTFAEAANKYSEDPANAGGAGGDLDYFSLNSGFIEEFTDVAFKLKKGIISDIVETPFGFHLIQVTDRKEGKPVDFDQNKAAIIQAFAAELQKSVVTAERKTAKFDIKPIPRDLFPPVSPAGEADAGAAKAKRRVRPSPSNKLLIGDGESQRSGHEIGRARYSNGDSTWRQVGVVKSSLCVQMHEPGISFGDAVSKRSVGERSQPALKSAVVEIRCDRQLPVAVRDERPRRRCDRAQGLQEPVDRLDRPSNIEALGTLEGMGESPDEGRRDVADILQVLPSPVTDPVRPAQRDRLDRLGRLTGHAEIPADAIDGPGTQPDARDAVVKPVHPGIELIADLESPVMRDRSKLHKVADGSRFLGAAGPWTAAELA